VALEREKQIKGWLRAKKIALIDSMNPAWNDLSEEWFVSLENVNAEKEPAGDRAHRQDD